ncbi:transcription termination/antitermination protein NusG [Microbacterium halophytorum]|uniref:transcription termination/antitermination protein NusG n=1 Tax=Microbacterium halophytorum TaxID=2067568 RepID=UPI000CFB15EA|nr:transcription termination/antitermination protein NusG [Microbacterium halophytorum]
MTTHNHRDDVDLSTAAEQSSEDDEAQDGNVLAEQELAAQPPETGAIHIEGGEPADEDIDITDPEADAIVNDALNIDETAEVEAAADVLSDDEAENGAAAENEAEGGAPEPDEDPYAEFKAELRALEGKWYVIHSYAGFERKVKANIEQRKATLEVEDDIYQVEVPMEDVVEIKNGQRKMVTRVRVPSYVLVRMELNEDTWSVVRHTPGVTGFVGNAHNPTPLRFEEAFNMLKPLAELKEAEKAASGEKSGAGEQKAAPRVIPAEVDFEIGETITIKEGSFAGLPGSISEINTASGKLTVLVSLFERETPVELGFDQVTKMI